MNLATFGTQYYSKDVTKNYLTLNADCFVTVMSCSVYKLSLQGITKRLGNLWLIKCLFAFVLQTGVFAVHVFGAQNLYFDATFPLEHSGMYVQIKVGSTTKCTSLQSPSKKGCIVWDDIKNFPATVSSFTISISNADQPLWPIIDNVSSCQELPFSQNWPTPLSNLQNECVISAELRSASDEIDRVLKGWIFWPLK